MASHVTFDPQREVFQAVIPYADRQIVSSLGYRWHPGSKRWETPNPELARATPFAKDAAASNRLRAIEEDFARAIEDSEATSAEDFEVPVPEGLAYLPYQKAGIRYARSRKRCLIADEPGLGKGHPLWYRVMTPAGPRPIGALKVGDDVIGSDGKPTTVTGVFDRGVLPILSVTLNDGCVVPVDPDHLWRVRTLPSVDSNWEILETREIRDRLERGESFEIPLMSGPAFRRSSPAEELDAAAWGAWLADASITSQPVTERKVAELLDMPSSYRQRFLWGYLATRGRFMKNGAITLSIAEPDYRSEISDVIMDLVRAVGGLCFWDSYKGNRSWKQTLVVHLPEDQARAVLGLVGRKLLPIRTGKAVRGVVPARTIVSIEPTGREAVRCISVAAADRLYVTEDYVVTHNTVQAVGLANVCRSVRQVLVLCPASLKVNWLREWMKWQVRGATVGIAGSASESYKDPETGKRKTRSVLKWPETDVVICNYDIAERFRTQIMKEDWDLLVCDEAQALKSRDAGRSKLVFGHYDRKAKAWIRGIQADRTLYLSGTPIVNKPADLWNFVRSCDPDGLGKDWLAYAYEFCGGEQTNFGFKADGATNLHDLHRRLRARMMVRRRKDDVLKELPPKTRQVIVLPSDGLRAKVDAERDALAAALAQYESELGIRSVEELTVDELSSLVARFRTVDYRAYADELETEGGPVEETPVTDLARARSDLALMKVPMVVEHVRQLLETESKVILFAWHKPVIQALRDAFPGCASISGDTPSTIRKDGSSARQDQVDRFQKDPDCRVFVGQIQAAGTGHTLTAARVVVFAELDWVPGSVTQAEDRAHRIGQLENVLVQHLVVENSLDDKVVLALIEKQAVIAAALDGKGTGHGTDAADRGLPLEDPRTAPASTGPRPDRQDDPEVAQHRPHHAFRRAIAPPRPRRAPAPLQSVGRHVRGFDDHREQY